MMSEPLMIRRDEPDRAVMKTARGRTRPCLLDGCARRSNRGGQCIGASAPMASDGAWQARREAVAEAPGKLFGTHVKPENIITETRQRQTPTPKSPRASQTRWFTDSGVIGTKKFVSRTYKMFKNHFHSMF